MLVYPAIIVALSIVHILYPQRNGYLALAQIFAPYLFIPLVLLIPFAFRRGAVVLRLLLLACAVIYCARYLPPLHFSSRTEVGGQQFTVATWNVFSGNKQFNSVQQLVYAKPADIVVLQESHWDWAKDEAQLAAVYPYRLIRPADTAQNMILLSTYPITDHGVLPKTPESPWDVTRLMWARLDLGNGRSVRVVTAHPISPYTHGRGCLPIICFNSGFRDEQIAAIRGFLDPLVKSGEPLVVMGDFNVTDREPAYQELAIGMKDAYLEVGTGSGNTWRPGFMLDANGCATWNRSHVQQFHCCPG